ncbi:hypothetical protein [Desertivibrio insolitus]|uniref:hypothetical protein n=1 Tax=Herbiconiux sp. SYSU D00978 TaxID=2812562 RepID=UPI001A97AC15|nr:hypothetical protein [Herbiconiux sp. SYSU D00978]
MSPVRKTLVAACLALTAAVAPAAPALAATAPKPTFVELIGVVRKLDASTAEVQARYRCTGDLHVWVSVKQVADRTADPRLTQEGSSQIAAAWSQTHAADLDCDGRVHVDRFVVDQSEQGFGRLERGQAWTQFCLVDLEVGVVASENEFKKLL